MKQAFSPSRVLNRNPSIEAFRYWEGMDWDRVQTHYAIIDPMDPRAVQYLTEQDYNRLTRVAITMETTIRVVARPGDEPPQDYETKKSKSLTKISPLLNTDFLQSKYWKSALSELIELKDTMVVIRPAKLGRIVSRYSIIVSAYSGVSLTPNLVKSITSFSYKSTQFLKSQGINNFILRLKITKLALEMYLAGQPADTAALGMKLSLSKGGLPMWLPLAARQAFLNRSIPLIRFWLSILNIYRAIQGQYDDPDFSSISAPRVDIDYDLQLDFAAYIKKLNNKLFIMGSLSELIPKRFPLLTTASGVNPGQSILSAPAAARLWDLQPTNHLVKWLEFLGDERGLRMFRKIQFLSRPWAHWYRRRFWLKKELFLGRLHLKYEPAGKIRVFAMVDYWTQYALLPMHQALFKVLNRFGASDATFDQDGAVRSFAGTCPEYYSYDLKSATDMIPISLYKLMFDEIWGKPVGDLWVSLMTDREFGLPVKDPKNHEYYKYNNKYHISYTRGQPMGALSSWAALALLHHYIVQYAAYRVFNKIQTFTQYRVLGDDIVIGNREVAESYLKVCEEFSIPIGLAKSVVSPKTSHEGKKGDRLFQFANQIALGSENISPLSLKEEIQANSIASRLELISKLVGRGWHITTGRKILSFYLRALNPTRWRLGVSQLTSGRIPLFVEVLLPLLLSPMSKDIGLTGLSKYYAWYQVLTGSYNFANLFKHKLWSSDLNLTKHKRFVEFLSERARDIYRDILVQQSWLGGEEKKNQLLIDIDSTYPQFESWWHPYVETFLDGSDNKEVVQEWFLPPGEPLPEDSPGVKLWQIYKESVKPLLSYEEKLKDGKVKVRNINMNLCNLLLVKEALSDYHKLIGETLSPLLKLMPDGQEDKHNAPSIFVFTVKDGIPTGSFIPRADMAPKQTVFALLTESEYKRTLNKDYRHDSNAFTASQERWDWKSPLKGAFRPISSIEATYNRLEELLSIQKMYDLMNPVDILKKTVSATGPPRVGYPVLVDRMLRQLRNTELRKHLFLLQEKIVPSLRVF
jgi:hypothetical protein